MYALNADMPSQRVEDERYYVKTCPTSNLEAKTMNTRYTYHSFNRSTFGMYPFPPYETGSHTTLTLDTSVVYTALSHRIFGTWNFHLHVTSKSK